MKQSMHDAFPTEFNSGVRGIAPYSIAPGATDDTDSAGLSAVAGQPGSLRGVRAFMSKMNFEDPCVFRRSLSCRIVAPLPGCLFVLCPQRYPPRTPSAFRGRPPPMEGADGTLLSSGNFFSITGARSDERQIRFGLRFSF
jgi:hypothetical protein